MKNIPEKIYLQVDADGELPEDFNECHEVSWCADNIYETDLVYYLANNHMENKTAEEAADQIYGQSNDPVNVRKKVAFIQGAKWMEQEIESKFKTEPVNFFLVNALRLLSKDQQISLRNALIERTPKIESFTEEAILKAADEIEMSTTDLNLLFEILKK